MAMKRQPKSEKAEHVLSTITKSFRSAEVSCSGVNLTTSLEGGAMLRLE